MKRLYLLTSYSITIIATVFFSMYLISIHSSTELPMSTPQPTSNIEYRVRQLEIQMAKNKTEQQELQQGINRIEDQYKNWSRPFEEYFAAYQKDYLERYREKNEG